MPSVNVAVTKPAPAAAQHPTITTSGIRGFLMWLQSDAQGKKIYARIKPQLQAMIANGQLPISTSLSGMGSLPHSLGFGQTDSLAPVDISGALTTPSFDLTTASAPTSSGSTGWANTLSSLIGDATQVAGAVENITTTNKVVNAQLQQAQAGKPPLNLSSYGLSTTPGFNLGLSGSTQSTFLMLGAGVLGVILLTSLMKHKK